MTNGELLKNNFPACWNKQAEFFSALIANDSRTGAIESVLDGAESYAKEYYSNSDVYEQTGEMLEKTVSFFTYLEKITNETEESYKNRMKVLFQRKNDTIWGSSLNVKHVFEQYFPLANVYVVENTSNIENDNLISDHDFSQSHQNWILEGSTSIQSEARFSKGLGVLIPSGSSNSISQSVNNLNKTKAYFAHMMYKGNIRAELISNNKYWDSVTRQWTTEETFVEFSSDEWANASIWCNTPESTVITLKIKGGEVDSYCDYFRFFEKLNYPSFSIVAQFDGGVAKSEMMLAPDMMMDPDNDYSGKFDYTYAKYLGPSNSNKSNEYTAFLTGIQAGYASDIYEDLLNYVRSSGIKAFLEIVNRDFIQD